MGNLFGVRRPKPTITAQDRAILQMKQQRDKIKIYQKRTEADLEASKQLAVQVFQNGNKDRALILLRRKKRMEEILTRTDKQLETLEQMVMDIEFSQIELSAVEGVKVATEALKQLNSLMCIDDIQQLVEDNEEAAQKQREISDILQRTAETFTKYDETDLLDELKSYQEAAAVVEQPKPATTEPTPVKRPDEAKAPPEPEQEPQPERQPEPVVEPALITLEPAAESVTTISQKIDEMPSIPETVPESQQPATRPKREKEQPTRQLEPAT